MLEIKNLSVTVADESGTANILKNVSLTVEDRKFVVITGPNGGGKNDAGQGGYGPGSCFLRFDPLERDGTRGKIHCRTGEPGRLLWISAAAPGSRG